MQRDGVNFALNAKTLRFEQRGAEKVTVYETKAMSMKWSSDQILIGIGRAPNVEGMGLETAGVKSISARVSK